MRKSDRPTVRCDYSSIWVITKDAKMHVHVPKYEKIKICITTGRKMKLCIKSKHVNNVYRTNE